MIAVFRDGTVEIEGDVVPIEGVAAKIEALSKSRNEIFYYREAGQEEPHPNAIKVITAAAEAGLPIMLSTKPDFSTYVDENGEVHQHDGRTRRQVVVD